ncbi:YwbE family protein [uncultured Methanomethylovorans sp.]|uniref:YwbE family protein n=1 Tax=uncultured Methanomethylovorans sp. TaxID=183759 RepID=UPI002AA77F8B|nr:YwbE family protein [uncultured Methanomethylovorans sp.]
MNAGNTRGNIKIGLNVGIVLKQDQGSGKITNGVVKRILTNSSFHPHGIKVQLQDGHVGRVKEIYASDATSGAR